MKNNLKQAILCVDYYPEHWPEERWPEDAKLMREAGISAVRIGEFAWCRMEPEENQFDFSWLDRAIDTLNAAGLKIILCTPTAAPPAWLIHAHLEILPVNREGRRLGFGSRRHYCFSSQIYREYSNRIARKLGERYGRHPAVIGWQIDNEPGCELPACYCDSCREAFQRWLQERYETLDALNRAWGTIFWSQEYSDWPQIPVPIATIGAHNPGLVLDFTRFTSNSICQYVHEQVKTLRELSPDRDITTNMYLFLSEPICGDHVNSSQLGKELDTVAFDNYSGTPHWSAFYNDLFRSMTGRLWVLETFSAAEPPRGFTSVDFQTWAHLSRGAEVVSYFRWRAPRFGAEAGIGYGLLQFDGRLNQGYMEVKRIGEVLKRNPIPTSKTLLTPLHLGMTYSFESSWARRIAGWELYPKILVEGPYRALFRMHLPVQFVFEPSEIQELDLLILPAQMINNPSLIEPLVQFVCEKGGILIATCDLALKEPSFSFGQSTLPNKYRELFGIHVERPYILHHEKLLASLGPEGLGEFSRFDLVRPEEADVIGQVTEGFFAGKPAVTRNARGKGFAYYLAGFFDSSGWETVLRYIIQTHFGLTIKPDDLDIVSWDCGEYTLTFILNYTDTPQPCELKIPGIDIIQEQPVGISFEMPGRSVRVIRSKK